jgi:hypothetical protein
MIPFGYDDMVPSLTTAAVRRSICNGSLVEQQLILCGSDDEPLILDTGSGGGTCVGILCRTSHVGDNRCQRLLGASHDCASR